MNWPKRYESRPSVLCSVCRLARLSTLSLWRVWLQSHCHSQDKFGQSSCRILLSSSRFRTVDFDGGRIKVRYESFFAVWVAYPPLSFLVFRAWSNQNICLFAFAPLVSVLYTCSNLQSSFLIHPRHYEQLLHPVSASPNRIYSVQQRYYSSLMNWSFLLSHLSAYSKHQAWYY